MSKKPTKAKRGRPFTLAPNMSERFMIRCTPDDLALWAACARTNQTSIGGFVRSTMRRIVKQP